METFTMSRKEAPRAGLVHAALAGRITNQQGATALRLSVRQFHRLRKRFARDGPRGLLHRGRGRPSPRRLDDGLRQRITALIITAYPGLNDVHLTEKLQEEHHLPISRASVRRLRRAAGQPASRRRRPRPHRHRRPREAAAGSLVQIDGSPFDWLEERGPTMTLLGAIDDATSRLLALHFRPTEDLHGYAVVFDQVFRQHGLPLAVYGDRLNILVRNDDHWSLEEELHGAQHPTHLGRLLQELGVGYIQAHSPQAKGRELLDGRLLVFYRAQCLAGLPSPGAAFVLRPRSAPSAQRRRPARSGAPPAIAPRLQEPRSGRGPRSPYPPKSTTPTTRSGRRSPSTPAPAHPWRTRFSPRRRAL